MKRFACGDVVPGCEASWVCSSEDEIMRRVTAHAREIHGMGSIPDDIAAHVRAAIRTD